MSDDEVAAVKKLGQDIRYWKKFAFPGFATGVLNLDSAIKSLDSPDPFIYARQDYPARWLVCKVGSQHKAMFHTAAVWGGSSHLDTGNYVPEGQTAPTNMPESRIQRVPSNRCQIDYIVDTRYDKCLFSQQAMFEKLVSKEKDFNRGGKPRRSWQKGDDGYDSTFTFSAQIFVRPYGYDVTKLKNPSYTLHPWVRDIVQPKLGKQDYFANPHRPEFWDCRSGTMIRMENADPPFPQKGDIMWITFFAEFIVGAHTWATQLTPRHFIRVATVPRILVDSAEGMGSQEEPDYTIEEGAAVVLNVDFPMEDETTDDRKTVDRIPVSGDPPTDSKASVVIDDKETVMDVVASAEPSLPGGGEQSSVQIHDDQMGESGEPLTPIPPSPGTATLAKHGSTAEDKVVPRGVKREGENDETEAGVPPKKSRPASTRRTRNA